MKEVGLIGKANLFDLELERAIFYYPTFYFYSCRHHQISLKMFQSHRLVYHQRIVLARVLVSVEYLLLPEQVLQVGSSGSDYLEPPKLEQVLQAGSSGSDYLEPEQVLLVLEVYLPPEQVRVLARVAHLPTEPRAYLMPEQA
jgi:hypothetical protein